jgi:hypothetical protein
MSQSVENRIFAKIRSTLIANTTVQKYVGSRVYAEHVSTVEKPIYPCISLHPLITRQSDQIPDMISPLIVQIDYWFQIENYTLDDLMECVAAVRTLLHRQNVSLSDSNLTIQQIVQTDAGPMMIEQDTHLRHYPSRFKVVAS